MKIAKFYISPVADDLMRKYPVAEEAYHEVEQSIIENNTPGEDIFILNNTSKNCNGVVPVKERCYQILEENIYGIGKSLSLTSTMTHKKVDR